MKHINEYIADIESKNEPSKEFYRFCQHIDRLDVTEEDLDNFSKEDMLNLFNQQSHYTYWYLVQFASFLRQYIKWLLEQGYMKNRAVLTYAQNCKFSEIFKENYEKSGRKEYINGKEFFSGYRDANLALSTNNLWYATFLRAIWEGIYSEDWVAIKELRASDVNLEKCTVHIHGTNGEIDIPVTEKLCKDLIKLSKIDYWERERKAFLIEHIAVEGKYFDSVFKLENRFNKHPYELSSVTLRTKFKNLTQTVFGRTLVAQKVFFSGIAYRIKLEAEKDGMTFSEYMHAAFSRYESKPYKVINRELEKVGIKGKRLQNVYRQNMYRFAKDFDDN